MRLRTYLVRRAIHTVITLLVVLVLLFVIFRLMPGDPTRFFIAPGQPPQVRDEICVNFGLCKWVPAAGNGYEGQVEAGEFGPYNISATVYDTLGNHGNFSFAYNFIPDFFDWRSGGAKIVNVSFSGPGWSHLPSVPDAAENDAITLEVQVIGVTGPTARLHLVKPAPLANESFDGTAQATPGYFQWLLTPAAPGFYWGRIEAGNATRTANVTIGFAVNPAVSGFQLVEDKFYGYQPLFPPSTAIVSINVTASAAPIFNVTAGVQGPGGFVQEDVRLYHPFRAVRRSLAEQFPIYFMQMLTGNFGTSFQTKIPVIDEISIRIGPTILLFGSAVVISYLLGVFLGAILAWRRGTKMEISAIVVSLFFYSMPVFWFGLVLLWFFSYTLHIFPLQGIGGFNPTTGDPYSGFQMVGDVLWHMALPLGNLVILGLAGHVLLMRNSMLEVMGEDYILTAKAKGLGERTVMYKHAARNALLPVVTALAISIGGVISGGVLTETIFSWPGMGAFLVQRTLQQDFPSVQAAFFILAVITILANTVADVLYAYLDPRVRL